MKNLRQSLTFWDYMIRLCLAILLTPLSCSNLCLIHLLSGIPHGIADNFSIHLSTLQYESFLVIDFINKLDRNLSTLRLVVSDFAK